MEQTHNKKSFLNKLAGSFVDMDEDVQAAPAKQPARTQPTVTPTQVATIVNAAPVVAPQGTEKFVSILQQSLEDRALSTYDYLKFRKAVASLKSIVFDEGSRFKAAFASASSSGGVTKTTLLDSTKHYLAALDEENKSFQNKLAQENETRVGGGQHELQNIDQQLATLNQEIQTRNQQIVTLASKRTELSNKIEQDKLLFSQTQASFAAALQTVGQEINSDAQKITTFITE